MKTPAMLSSLLLLALASAALAQVTVQPVQYKEIPRSMEFSGQMIARPLQPDALGRAGLSPREAQHLRAVAQDLVAGITVHYVEATDEYILKIPKGWNENSLASYLMASGTFQYVEPDWILYPVAIPNDAQYGSQWHLPHIGLPAAWDHFRGGTAITIAITDTGVRLDHQDLAARLVPGANSAGTTVTPQASGGAVNDINGHGTHCAGIAGAIGNNLVGIAGANWTINIMPIRVTNSSGGSSQLSYLTNGARWAADNGARVISTSYSGVSSASVGTTGTYIKNTRNGLYCWAAGNDNAVRSVDHVDVTIVGASTQTDGKASFSAYGPALDLFAPGVSILSTYNSSATSYSTLSGTSMACPLAAGVGALIMGTNPALTAQQVETILYTTCVDLIGPNGAPGNDDYWGWGRVNADAAIAAAYQTIPFSPAGFTVLQGTQTGGNLASLVDSDNNRLVVQQANGSDVQVEFTATSTNLLVGQLQFVMESSTSLVKAIQEVELFDYAANAFVPVNTSTIPSTDVTITVSPPNPSRFLHPVTRQMRARVTYPLGWSSSRNSSLSIDRVGWFTMN